MEQEIFQQYRTRIGQLSQVPMSNTPFSHNAIVHWVTIFVIVILLVVIGILAFSITSADVVVKLQYNIYFGSSVQAIWWSPYVLVGMGAFFYILDYFLAAILYRNRVRIAAYCLLLGGLFAHIALLIAIIGIVLNN